MVTFTDTVPCYDHEARRLYMVDAQPGGNGLAHWAYQHAEELLTVKQGGAVVGEQTVCVIRKGTRDYQELAATSDAFVWLLLYQESAWKKGVPQGAATTRCGGRCGAHGGRWSTTRRA